MIDYKLIHGDCLEEMRKMPDKCVDVVFTSPPYNDSGCTENDKKHRRHFKYEVAENREDWYEWQIECIDEMMRVAKREVLYNVQTILNNKADVYRLIGHYADKIDNILVWYKPNAQPQHYPNRIGNYYELVIIFKCSEFDKLWVNTTGYSNVIMKSINSDRTYSDIHNAVMSEPFCSEIISQFTKPDEVVLDPFMGLATTGIVCNKHHRGFVGIEIHKPYFDIAEKRMKNATSQMDIFDFIEGVS